MGLKKISHTPDSRLPQDDYPEPCLDLGTGYWDSPKVANPTLSRSLFNHSYPMNGSSGVPCQAKHATSGRTDRGARATNLLLLLIFSYLRHKEKGTCEDPANETSLVGRFSVKRKKRICNAPRHLSGSKNFETRSLPLKLQIALLRIGRKV